MLILSRKRNERIILHLPDQTIAIVVVAVQGNKVRLGVEAPRDVTVLREELAVEHGTDLPDGSKAVRER
jgi:carbon storage regulator